MSDVTPVPEGEEPDVRLNLTAKAEGSISLNVVLGLKPYILIEADTEDDVIVFDVEAGGGIATTDADTLPSQIAEMLDYVVQFLREGQATPSDETATS